MRRPSAREAELAIRDTLRARERFTERPQQARDESRRETGRTATESLSKAGVELPLGDRLVVDQLGPRIGVIPPIAVPNRKALPAPDHPSPGTHQARAQPKNLPPRV